jgi:hypothetical protein
MVKETADKIISSYKKALGKGTVGETVLRKQSWLPYSKATVKYAYFTVIEDIIENEDKLPTDLRSEMTEDYKQLNSFVPDSTAEKFAKDKETWEGKKSDPFRNKRDESSIKQYIGYTHFIQNDNLFDEINDFIEELTDGKK